MSLEFRLRTHSPSVVSSPETVDSTGSALGSRSTENVKKYGDNELADVRF